MLDFICSVIYLNPIWHFTSDIEPAFTSNYIWTHLSSPWALLQFTCKLIETIQKASLKNATCTALSKLSLDHQVFYQEYNVHKTKHLILQRLLEVLRRFITVLAFIQLHSLCLILLILFVAHHNHIREPSAQRRLRNWNGRLNHAIS